MSNNTQMVVASRYELEARDTRKDSPWDYQQDGQKKLLQEDKFLKRSYVEERNSQNNNELYIIDEEKTKEYYKIREKSIIANKDKKDRSNIGMDDLIQVVAKTAVNNTNSGNRVAESYPDGDPDKTWSLSELKLFCKDNNIKFHHKNKEDKLLELINEN